MGCGSLGEVSCETISARSTDSKLSGVLSVLTIRFGSFFVADSFVCSWALGILIFEPESNS